MDRALVARAARHQNVIGRDELVAMGLGYDAVASRQASGWLTELFLGAYFVGRGNITRRSYWKAATVSCGEGSHLSHRAGAQLTGLATLIPGPPHVTVPHGRTLERPGIVVHRTRHLPPSQTTVLHGIPVTTPARTLLDFASQASPSELRDAVRAGERLELLEAHEVAALCDAARGRKGTGNLRRALAVQRGPVTRTRSPLEELFLPICVDFGIRVPMVNVPVLEFEVDCLWMPERLIVELDGYEWHKSRESFEGDRRRDVSLGVAGYHVVRLTDSRLRGERALVAAELIALLERLRRYRSTVETASLP